MRKKITIFEPHFSGHRIDFIKANMDYCINYEREIEILLIVNKKSGLKEVLKNKSNVEVIYISDKEFEKINQRNLIKRSFGIYKVLKSYIKSKKIKYIYYDSIDWIMPVFALGLRLSKDVKLFGIMYRADFHYGKVFNSPSKSLIDELKRYTKKLVLYLSLNNTNLFKVLTLDPFLMDSLSKSYQKKMRYIPDPAFYDALNEDNEYFNNLNVKNKYILTLFGHIDYRKGTLQLLDSLFQLPKEIQQQITLIIAGDISGNIYQTILDKISEIKKRTRIQMIMDPRYLDFKELTALVKNSSVILAPYIRFPGSSGVLYWAASAGKPIITQKYGLLGRLCNDYRLGYAIDTENLEEIASTIKDYIERRGVIPNVFTSILVNQFWTNNTPKRFSETIFKTFHEATHSVS